MVKIPHSVVHAMRHHAERDYPEECCGVLLGSGDVSEVAEARACTNAHPDRRTRYAIAPQELIAAQRAARERGLTIVGFYHSHPDHPAEPSATDGAEAAWPEALHVIVSVTPKGAAEAKVFRFAKRDDGAAEAENIALRVTSD